MEAPDDFIQRSSLLSRNNDFSNMGSLEIDLMAFKKDIPGLKTMISRMPNLTTLTMNESKGKGTRVCSGCGTEDGLWGSLQANDSRVRIHVQPGDQADLVYQLLKVSRFTDGLNIELFVDLKDTLAKDISGSNWPGPIYSVMRHPSTHSLVIRGTRGDLIRQLSLSLSNDSLPNLKHLDINFSKSRQNLYSIMLMISKAPYLTSLMVDDSWDGRAHTCDGCDTVYTLERPFEVIDGVVKIHLRSAIQAESVYQALKTSRSISGLDIDLHVDMRNRTLGRILGLGTSLKIMQHPSTRSVAIDLLRTLSNNPA
ncbi:hypothetical protein BGX31_011534 [Mortierella sp. GBA43]|nr:hypothetical protein BGX31_011534 [Mortierella sp. GBA43]